MKKLLFSLILIASATFAFSQVDTTLTNLNYREYATGIKSIVADFQSDTIGIGDTVFINLPHILSTAFVGSASITYVDVDTLDGEGEGLAVIQKAPTSSGPWYPVQSIPIAFDDINILGSSFKLDLMFVRVLLIATDNRGKMRLILTLKPSSIN